jgi:hypothetical protein
VLLAVWAAGSIVGGLVYGGLSLRASHRSQLPVLVTALAVGTALPLLATGTAALGVALFVFGLTIAPFSACNSVLLGRAAPAGTVTEAFAWSTSMIFGGAALASGVSGVLVERSGSTAALLVTAGAGLLALGTSAAAWWRSGSPWRPRVRPVRRTATLLVLTLLLALQEPGRVWPPTRSRTPPERCAGCRRRSPGRPPACRRRRGASTPAGASSRTCGADAPRPSRTQRRPQRADAARVRLSRIVAAAYRTPVPQSFVLVLSGPQALRAVTTAQGDLDRASGSTADLLRVAAQERDRARTAAERAQRCSARRPSRPRRSRRRSTTSGRRRRRPARSCERPGPGSSRPG